MNALGRKDVAAAALTALVVLTFAATHQGWNVWLVGGSHRWAAGVITVLGIAGCGLGEPKRTTGTMILSVLGTLALALSATALLTGSLTPLSLLVVDIVLLWLASTLAHIRHDRQQPIAF